MKSYVLVSPARNEEAYIERTIQSVISQTVLPKRWVIVSDGSVDRTDEIVTRYADEYDFILLLRRSGDQERNFGSKVRAFTHGYEHLKDLQFDFVGNLDADVSFDPRYYEGVLAKFEENERLGVAGGIRYDLWNGRFRRVRCASNSVGGPFQLFRRQCYEEIGGYRPLPLGGVDAVAETMARMHGWEVRHFPELEVYHYRYTGTAGGSVLRARFRSGMQAYSLGYHPVFLMASSVLRMRGHTPVLGSLFRLAGYSWAFLRAHERGVPNHFVQYLRKEQLARLQTALLGNSGPRVAGED